jgi:hypothetical protein
MFFRIQIESYIALCYSSHCVCEMHSVCFIPHPPPPHLDYFPSLFFIFFLHALPFPHYPLRLSCRVAISVIHTEYYPLMHRALIIHCRQPSVRVDNLSRCTHKWSSSQFRNICDVLQESLKLREEDVSE